ncbi:MAG: hypothetical protein KGD63_05915 [Candidatus Lokiarchaeota archaeon]|nr:hypothetical protein [Candidatus Lokiarchaeota archaeon]
MANPYSRKIEREKEKEQRDYLREMKEKYSQKTYECKYCGVKFDKEHGLKVHLKQWCKKKPEIITRQNTSDIVKISAYEHAKQKIDMLMGYFKFFPGDSELTRKGLEILMELEQIIRENMKK